MYGLVTVRVSVCGYVCVYASASHLVEEFVYLIRPEPALQRPQLLLVVARLTQRNLVGAVRACDALPLHLQHRERHLERTNRQSLEVSEGESKSAHRVHACMCVHVCASLICV